METIIAFTFVLGLPIMLLIEEIVVRFHSAHTPVEQVAYEHAHQAGRA